MKKRLYILTLVALLLFSPCAYSQSVSKSTLDDQKSVEVTVYNNNLGLVKDIRSIDLPKGEGELRFMDVASKIMPVTVHVESLNLPGELAVLEQNYEYDLMNQDKLLDKYVGKEIKIISWTTYEDKKEKEEVDAVLLSNNKGQIYKIEDEIYLGHPGYKVLPKIPENLIAKPTLTWLYQNRSQQAHDLEVSYLTNGIKWKADYIVLLNKDDTSSDLTGWVTLDNKSGATYKDAKLKLVAGEVNRVSGMEGGAIGRRGSDDIHFEAMSVPQFAEESFFEYHIYDLQRKTTIKNKQTKQVSLLEANAVDVKKEFIVEGQQHYYRSNYGGRKDLKSPVNVYLKFKNSEENNLGMPLPAGIMRLYKEDSKGSLQFIGEDSIKHTPKDEEVKLKIGEAFDIVVERLQVSYSRPNSRVYESEWEITIRNHKKEDIVVVLLEPMFGDWRLMSPTHEFKKIDASTVRYDVDVAKDEEVKVKYKVVSKMF